MIAGILEVVILSVVYYWKWDEYRSIMQYVLFMFRGKAVLIALYAVITFVVFKACDSFNFGIIKILDVTVSQCISVVIVNFITYLQTCLIANTLITPMPLVVLTLIDFVICTLCSYIATRFHRKFCRVDDVLFIYGSGLALELKKKVDRARELYMISEVVSSSVEEQVLKESIDRHKAVFINDIPAERRNDILKYCFSKGKAVYLVPKISDIIVKGTENVNSFDIPLLKVRESISPFEEVVKRGVDLIISMVLLIVLSPFIFAIAICIKVEDGGSVFYRQKRLTLNDKVFEILKFRSMVADAEKYTGAIVAEKDDPRITKVGRFLRACRLDELPQLINIFLGDMSFVGPRPERPELAADIIKDTPEFAFRTKVKGGLTGYAQVYGKYSTSNYDKLRLDLIYIENYSLLLDLKLLFMTPQILFRKEASEGVERKDR